MKSHQSKSKKAKNSQIVPGMEVASNSWRGSDVVPFALFGLLIEEISLIVE